MYNPNNVTQHLGVEYDGVLTCATKTHEPKRYSSRVGIHDNYFSIDRPEGFVQRSDAELEVPMRVIQTETVEIHEDVRLRSLREDFLLDEVPWQYPGDFSELEANLSWLNSLSSKAIYKPELSGRLDPTTSTLHFILDKVKANPRRVVFAEGEDDRVIRAAIQFRDAGYGEPVLIGRDFGRGGTIRS